MEYAAAYYRVHQTLSPEILEAAASIDPDNAWYAAIQASAKAKKAVKKQTPGYDARKRGEKTTYKVTDEKEFASALELFREATRKPSLTQHQVELQKQRFTLLPKRRDFVSQFPAQVFAASQSCALIDLRSLVDAISVQAGRYAERKDVAGFQQLVADWRWLVGAATRDGVSLLDVLVAKAFFIMPLREFSDAAKVLGLEADSERFACLCLGKRSLHSATLARLMVPACLFGMLIFALLMPFHYAEERHWIQQDHLLEITAASPAMNRYESDLTEVLRKELMEKVN